MRVYLIVSFLSFFISANAQLKIQEGVASYYGGRFHGKLTANGEVFDKGKMTAAHRSLPFGTTVKVTREDNGKFVYVRINDRGPFIRGRIIDLSQKAASKLGIIHRGHQKVLLEIVEVNKKITDEFLGDRPYKKVNTKLAALPAKRVRFPKVRLNILPVFKRKEAIIDLPVVDNASETFFKKVLQEVFPKS